ncbi:unnamed protein product [Hapterophycus canaliculatus]
MHPTRCSPVLFSALLYSALGFCWTHLLISKEALCVSKVGSWFYVDANACV